MEYRSYVLYTNIIAESNGSLSSLKVSHLCLATGESATSTLTILLSILKVPFGKPTFLSLMDSGMNNRPRVPNTTVPTSNGNKTLVLLTTNELPVIKLYVPLFANYTIPI